MRPSYFVPIHISNPARAYVGKPTCFLLADFENTVNANREAALKALEDVSKIDAIIDEASAKTTSAKEAMQGADSSANLALSVAKDAEKIAQDASEKAGIIKEKATESRESAADLSAATNSLTDKLRETKGRLATKEEIAANDGESAHNALEKANQAQQKAKEAAEKVERAKAELEEISAILATVQEPGLRLFRWNEQTETLTYSLIFRAWIIRRASEKSWSCGAKV